MIPLIKHARLYYVQPQIDKFHYIPILDCGSQCSLLDECFVPPPVRRNKQFIILQGINGGNLGCKEIVTLYIFVGNHAFRQILTIVKFKNQCSILLGTDFMNQHIFQLSHTDGILT